MRSNYQMMGLHNNKPSFLPTDGTLGVKGRRVVCRSGQTRFLLTNGIPEINDRAQTSVN